MLRTTVSYTYLILIQSSSVAAGEVIVLEIKIKTATSISFRRKTQKNNKIMKNVVLFTVSLVTAVALGTVYSKLFSLSVSIVFSLCTGSFIGCILYDLLELEDND